MNTFVAVVALLCVTGIIISAIIAIFSYDRDALELRHKATISDRIESDLSIDSEKSKHKSVS